MVLSRLLKGIRHNSAPPSPQNYSGLSLIESELNAALEKLQTNLNERQRYWQDTWRVASATIEGLLNAGKLSESLGHTDWASYFMKRCLTLDPYCIPANNRLGIYCYLEQDLDGAISYFAKAANGPQFLEICVANLGIALYTAGEENDALVLLQQYHERYPDSDAIAKPLFYVCLWMGKIELAEKVVSHALSHQLQPIADSELNEIGGLLKFEAAPDQDWTSIGNAQLALQTGNHDRARKLYLALQKKNPKVSYSGLGVIAFTEGKFDAAVHLFSQAMAFESAPRAHLHLNRAKALIGLGCFDEAHAELDFGLNLQPDLASIRLELAINQLRRGNWLEAWDDYEVRRDFSPDSLFSFFDQTAEWRGEPLQGKTIILVGEQGQGDVIQFVRFARDLAHEADEVIVHSVPSLHRLVGTVPGVARTFTVGEVIPPYDYWIPLLSVPRWIKLSLDTLRWDGPYIRPHEEDVARWRQRLEQYSGMRVGYVWSGNDYTGQIWGQLYGRRNLSLEQLRPLLDLPGQTCFSLQKGGARGQLATAGTRLIDYSDEWSDFLDTAAFIANLDLVITVDTSVAHLAGALGIPVWILSRTDGCWRWLGRRTDSPWYPSARIYHQEADEPWSAVIERVRQELLRFAS